MSTNPVDLITAHLGITLEELGKRFDISKGAVSQWKDGIPVARCASLEAMTGKVVTRQMMRPNDWKKYWPDLEEPSVAILHPGDALGYNGMESKAEKKDGA
jgi:hypothetical protein